MPNLWIYDKQDILVGTAVFAGHNEEGETTELNAEQFAKVREYVKRNAITQQELFQMIFGVCL